MSCYIRYDWTITIVSERKNYLDSEKLREDKKSHDFQISSHNLEGHYSDDNNWFKSQSFYVIIIVAILVIYGNKIVSDNVSYEQLCKLYVLISISLWSIRVSDIDYFCRIDISRLSLRPSKDTFCADHLPRGDIVTTSNFVRRWTVGHLAIRLETGPTDASLRLEPIESNFHVRSLVHPQTSSIARENDSQVPVFTRAVIF